MAPTASELSSVLALLGKIGAVLVAVYVLTAVSARMSRRRLRRYTLSSGRMLIGRKVKVVRMVAPPKEGAARLLDDDGLGDPIDVWSDRVVRPGQRARITTLDERGYKIMPLARDKTVKPRRVRGSTGR